MHDARASLSAHNSAFIPTNFMAEEQAKKTYNTPNYAKIIADRACKDTKHAKLALFAQYCYSMGSYKSANNQEIETLLPSNISHRADDKGSPRILQRLATPFGRAVSGAMMAGALIATPMSAMANDGVPATTVASRNVTTTLEVTPIETPIVVKGEKGNRSYNHRKEVVRTAAARQSDDRYSFIAYGMRPNDPRSRDFYQKVWDFAVEAQKSGPRVALVWGTSDPAKFDVGFHQDKENPLHLEIYANGHLINDKFPVKPYLNTDHGLVENPDFQTDAQAVFGEAKITLHKSLELEKRLKGKQASLQSTMLTNLPN